MKKIIKINPLALLVLLIVFAIFYSCAIDNSKVASDPSGATATFSSINTGILAKKCTGCHNSTSLQGNLDLSTYAKVTQSTQIVNVASPASSKLYTRVKNTAPLMPLGGSALADSDTQTILDWITAGALNN